MKLYLAPKTISIVVAIALEEAKLDYEPVKIDFAQAEQTQADYLKVNPKGRVPALLTDYGLLTETGAILELIYTLAPSSNLVPDNPYLAARMREAMYYLATTMHVNHAHRMRGTRWADNEASFEDMRQKVPHTMHASCEYLESNFDFGPYVLGSAFSLADPYLFVISTWLDGDGVDIARFPKLTAFQQAMNARASVMHLRDAGMF